MTLHHSSGTVVPWGLTSTEDTYRQERTTGRSPDGGGVEEWGREYLCGPPFSVPETPQARDDTEYIGTVKVPSLILPPVKRNRKCVSLLK